MRQTMLGSLGTHVLGVNSGSNLDIQDGGDIAPVRRYDRG
jgi:hypothetical protein